MDFDLHNELDRIYAARDRHNMGPTIAALVPLAERHPNDFRVLYEVGGAYDTAGEEEAAAKFYERAIANGLDGDVRLRCYLQYGSTLRNLGRLAESVTVFARARSEYPGSVALGAFEALTLHAAGRVDAALGNVLALLADHVPAEELDRYRPALHGNAEYLATRDPSMVPESPVQLSTAEASDSGSRAEPGRETWHDRVEEFWSSADKNKPDLVMAAMRQLVEERSEADPDAIYEWASVHDFLGQQAEAIPLYRAAIANGLDGDRSPQAIIQLASSLRNEGEAESAIDLLQGRATDTVTGSSSQAFLALALFDSGRYRDALRVALDALAPTLPLYGPAVSRYANALVEPPEDS
jgi:tetratricopeptide (TPR) repeat protein